MNKTLITVTLMSVALLLGCGTIKSWFSGEDKAKREEQFAPPPSEKNVKQNPDGTWDFEGHEQTRSTTNWLGWILLFGFLAVVSLLARHILKL